MLAMLTKFDMALFVIGRYETFQAMDAAETELIHRHDATNMNHGLNSIKKTAKTTNQPKALRSRPMKHS